MNAIINNILDFTGGEKFYRFGNADGKFWIMPARGMRTAMNLYQPSGSKGKMVKRLFPLLHRLTPVQRAIHAQVLHCQLKRELHELLCKLFKVDDLEFSIFEGTPSASQKMTMQISCGKELLGYCKISNDKKIFDLFRKEHDNLEWLKEKQIKGIPHSLFCGNYNDLFLFAQSTAKTNGSKIPHEFTQMHRNFIEQTYKTTRTVMPLQQSDFYTGVKYLKSIINNIREKERPIFESGINIIEKHYAGEENVFSFFHGDFTPWNMFVEKNELFVFDFEFAGKSFPPRMDMIHFVLQAWILEKKLNADKIYPLLEEFKKRHSLSSALTVCYLVHILSFYFRLYNGNFDTNDNGYITWCALLRKQIEDIE